jgi:beta-glucosidase
MSKPWRIVHIPVPVPSLWLLLCLVGFTLVVMDVAVVAVQHSTPPPAKTAPTPQLNKELFLPIAEKPSNAELASPALNARVDQLLGRMSLDEKIGQLSQYSAGELTGPEGEKLDYKKMVAAGQVGSLFNVVGAKETNEYQHIAVEQSPLHIPLLFGYDVIHGQHTIFPVPLALASSFDPALVRQVARTAAEESSDDGIRWVFSPMVDIARDARWGRITEGAGEDPFLGSVLAKAYVEGYQGTSLTHPDSVAACIKHFAAYGAPSGGREYNTVDMSELSLRQFYLPPYRAGVEAGAATVMSAFNPLNGVPATANPFTLTQILRNEWKFDGFVVSDWGAVRELINHGIAQNGGVAARKAITAGVDMDMQSDIYRTRLADLVNSGQVPLAVLDEAVRRVLRVKFALGLFDHPYTTEKPPFVLTPEKRAMARQAAEQTLVLLKNNVALPDTVPVLPLSKNLPAIALIGPLADSNIDMLGSWPASGNPAEAVTLLAALQHRFQDTKTTVLYAQGTDANGDSDQGFAEAVAAAQKASVVILALGEPAETMTGESTSRTRLDLPGNQEQLLETIVRLGKPTILVLFNGHPLAFKWAFDHVPAILEAWYPGTEAGNAVSNVLFGDVNPSGKLPVSLPRAVGQEPLFYNQLPTGRPAGNIDLDKPPVGQDKYFSRYIDETNAPLFPFGFGLSYTQFTYSNLKLSQGQLSIAALEAAREKNPNSTPGIHVSVEVKNTGPVAGTEVVQLYIRNTGGSVEEPVRELKGFQRITLNPGQMKEVAFDLGFEDLSYYNLDMDRVIEPTEYQVWVGGSSGATLGSQFDVTP